MENNATLRASAAAIDAYLVAVKKLKALNAELDGIRAALQDMSHPNQMQAIVATGVAHIISYDYIGLTKDIATNVAACNREVKRIKNG